jgi:SAM-dependent methyltransferase
MRFDRTGKVDFGRIYTQPDPRAYFTTLRALDYRIPQHAAPYFRQLINRYRLSRGVPVPTVLDVGCSYGINAGLYRRRVGIDELYDHYDGYTGSRTALIEHDRNLVGAGAHDVRWVGLDTSRPALAYAVETGLLDAAVHADLEAAEPTAQESAILGSADLVVSTGCLGYVTDRTLLRIVSANPERQPWMAHFVLRMFPFDSIAGRLSELGYCTVMLDGTFRQRRFASAEEQHQMLQAMGRAGVDPDGVETDGWLYARLYVSRPPDIGEPLVLDGCPTQRVLR